MRSRLHRAPRAPRIPRTPPPERIAPETLAELMEARARLVAAHAQLEAAHHAYQAATAVADYLAGQVATRYRLGPEDSVTTEGLIQRASQPTD